MATFEPEASPHLSIRDAEPADAPALAAFAAAVFRETYRPMTRGEDLDAHIAQHFGPDRQAAEITAPDCRTLLVELGETLVGYAQLRRGPAPPCVVGAATPADALEIQRFYVASAYRGRGVAQQLMAACLSAATTPTPVWLGVFARNPRAIAFYEKCGFRTVGETVFLLGADPQPDRVMARRSTAEAPRDHHERSHSAARDRPAT